MLLLRWDVISGKEYVEGEKVGGGYCSGDENKLFE